MFNYINIATKIGNILNGTDAETIAITRPVDYIFEVKCYGDFLKNIGDQTAKKNTIPVYISNIQGNYDALPDFASGECVVPIYFYFPYTMRNNILAFQEFLENCFIGKILNFVDDYCICNIEPLNFANIENESFVEFKSWITEQNYGVQVETTRHWIQCVLNLHLSASKGLYSTNGAILGNQIKTNISFVYNDTTYSEDLVDVNSGDVMELTINGQQILTGNGNTTTSLATANTNSLTFRAYLRNNAFWKKIIELKNSGGLQNLTFSITKSWYLDSNTTSAITESFSSMLLTQCALSINKGEKVYATLSFGRKSEVE